MTVAILGRTALAVGWSACVLAVVALLRGLRAAGPGRRIVLRSGWAYALVVAVAALVACVAMEIALIGHDFSLVYVAEHGSRATPLLYTVASLWAALEGSLLLWVLVLGAFILAVAQRFRHRLDDELVAWALLVMFVVAIFFFGLLLGPANPFKVLPASQVPADGPGPNPLLQNHPLMAFHPPMLYLGYVGFTVPFAFALAALITGRLGEGWLVETRRWTLAAWGFLTLGIVLGAWWSYEVLGWGGYWAWDPVENASFLPWLTGTAFIHSVLVQERRAMLRVWNLSLLISTFSLTILGTFLTRSGVLDSVHAFSDSRIGPLILGFFGLTVLVGVGLIGWRGDRLRSPGSIDSAVSREAAFLLNNLIFGVFAFVVLLGTVFPLLVEALRGDRLAVGRPYFDRMTIPLGLTLLFLMAVAPALPWRKASRGVLQDRLLVPAVFGTVVLVVSVVLGARGLAAPIAFGLGGFAGAAAFRQLFLAVRRSGFRGLVGRANGGMVVHLGVVAVAVGLAASGSFDTARDVRLAEGQSTSVAGHSVRYLGMTQSKEANRTTVTARVEVNGSKVYEPSLHQYQNATQTIATPSVRTTLRDDVYLVLRVSPAAAGGSAVIGVVVSPLVVWLWIGGAVMALGTVLAIFPGRRRQPTSPASAP